MTPAVASDCEVITNDIILRLPDPMIERTFGYTDAVDINLSIKGNGIWLYGQCVVFIRNPVMRTSRDRFRFVDVAYTAQRITQQCVEGTKLAIGGSADIGTIEDNFYVAVGGVTNPGLKNSTFLGLVSNTEVSSLSSKLSASTLRNRTKSTPSQDSSRTKFADLE